MQILDALDAQQRAAATAPDGRSLIAAGAGTGKTLTLTARIAWLLESGRARPGEIMAVTFTNKAAREIRERLSATIGPAASELRLGTFHSLSVRILRRHATQAGLRGGSFEIVDEDASLEMISEAVLESGAYASYAPSPPPPEADAKAVAAMERAEKRRWEAGLREFAKEAQRQVSRWKSWGLTAAMAGEATRQRRSEREEALITVYLAYQDALERRNACDFGDLVLRIVSLFDADPGIAREESSRVKYLLVDEAQDANSVQARWACYLSSHHGNLTVIGDEDQNIFAFQGGYPGAMQEMAGPGALEFALTTNRRCAEEILAPANAIVDYNRRRTPKTLASGMHGGQVVVAMHDNEVQEANAVAARVATLMADGTPASEIACLVRAGYVAAPLEEALARAHVPYRMVGGSSLGEREEVRDVAAYLRLAVDPFNEADFRRISNKPARGVGAAATDAVCDVAATRGMLLHEACSVVASQTGTRMRKETRQGLAALGRALLILAEDARFGRPAPDLLRAALHDTGYARSLEDAENAVRRRQSIDLLERTAEDCEDVVDLLHEISLLTDAEVSDESARVRISTVHAAKGLEFDHVLCPAFETGVFPHPRAVEEGARGRPGDPWNGPLGGGIEEERRLAHVAFTRARKGLYLSFPNQRLGSRNRTAGPSCFIAECRLEVTEMPSAFPAAPRPRKKKKARAGRKGFERRR